MVKPTTFLNHYQNEGKISENKLPGRDQVWRLLSDRHFTEFKFVQYVCLFDLRYDVFHGQKVESRQLQGLLFQVLQAYCPSSSGNPPYDHITSLEQPDKHPQKKTAKIHIHIPHQVGGIALSSMLNCSPWTELNFQDFYVMLLYQWNKSQFLRVKIHKKKTQKISPPIRNEDQHRSPQ